MEQAGRAVADAVIARHATGSKVTVVTGPGNNGGDGFVAARLLAEEGYRVTAMLVGAYSQLKGDAALAAKKWPGGVTDDPGFLATADVIIDALFGAGLDRPVEGAARTVIEAMNALAKPVVAVDLPSGVNGTSGAVLGVAVNATQTVTFFRKKPGHLLLPGRLHCGALSVADIGIPASVLPGIGPKTFENVPELWRGHFPQPARGGHKYDRGHAVVASEAPPGRQVQLGSPRVGRCGPAQGWSRSQARVRPSRSMPRRASP
jgi:hydroxyethylthiazole kinase-like uncharacterized protein yjeF